MPNHNNSSSFWGLILILIKILFKLDYTICLQAVSDLCLHLSHTKCKQTKSWLMEKEEGGTYLNRRGRGACCPLWTNLCPNRASTWWVFGIIWRSSTILKILFTLFWPTLPTYDSQQREVKLLNVPWESYVNRW